MKFEELTHKIKSYQNFENFEVSFKRNQDVEFENRYIKLLSIETSNKWLGEPHKSNMTKQWGIIIKLKDNFIHFEGFKQLLKIFNVDLTPVRFGQFKGNYGIRFYDMAQNPDKEIVIDILNYIFENKK